MWFPLAIGCAIFYALHGYAAKEAQKGFPTVTVAFYSSMLSAPLLLAALLFAPPPDIQPGFFFYLAVSVSLNFFIVLLFFSALRESPLSATYPTLGLTPVFMLVTTPLLTGEGASTVASGGVALIFVGFFLLGGFTPARFFRFLRRERGVQKMVVVALMWSIGANVDKLAITRSSPLFYALLLEIFLAAGYYPLARKAATASAPKGRRSRRAPLLMLCGLTVFLMIIFQFSALRTGVPSLVIAVKRSGMLITVFLDALVYRDHASIARLPAVLLILAGVFLIAVGA